MKNIKIGIVDDNQEYCSNLLDFFQKQENIQVEFIAKDGQEGIKYIKQHNVDVLLLDIVMPRLDGYGLLEALNEDEEIKYLPNIIITSAVSQDIMVQKAIELGAAYFMVKPVNLNMLLKRIYQLSNPLHRYIKSTKPIKSSILKESSNTYELELYITNLLHELGVPAHVKGYKFIKDAIMLVIKDNSLLNHITKELYPRISIMNNSTPLRVERGIRTAILIAWDRGNKDIIDNIFGYTINTNKGKPTNSEFVALLADKVRLEIML